MSPIRRLHVALKAPEDVIPHLGSPFHWKEGRSAKRLVDQWWSANAVPASVRKLLDQSTQWQDAALVDAFLERLTDLKDGRPSHSQSDLLAILAVSHRLGVVAIEAKVDEGFGEHVADWLKSGSNGKLARITSLCRLVEVQVEDVGPLRYQLLHRTASAILEAQRYQAPQAAMIVQSWCPHDSGLLDFMQFARAIRVQLTGPDILSEPRLLGGVSVRVAWVREASQPQPGSTRYPGEAM